MMTPLINWAYANPFAVYALITVSMLLLGALMLPNPERIVSRQVPNKPAKRRMFLASIVATYEAGELHLHPDEVLADAQREIDHTVSAMLNGWRDAEADALHAKLLEISDHITTLVTVRHGNVFGVDGMTRLLK